MKLRMQPIRVFCFHHVSAVYNPDVYCKPDWIPLDFLKNYLEQLQAEGYKFISLAEAQTKISNDKFRIGKYAVLAVLGLRVVEIFDVPGIILLGAWAGC